MPFPPRLTLAHRLFLAVLAAFLGVAAIGMLLVRWGVADAAGPAPAVARQQAAADAALLDRLQARLCAQHAAAGGWTFLPPDAAARERWLAAQMAAAGVPALDPAPSPGLDHRVALLDARRATLAGETPGPLLVALASIDTIEHALVVDGRRIGTLVEARADNADNDLAVAFLVQQQHHLALLAGVVLLLSVVAAAWLAQHFRRPIADLVAGARQLAAGHLQTRLNTRRSDELGELARTFDALAARLEEADAQRRQWVADTSHELRTPLAVLRAQLEALQDGVRPPTPDNLAILSTQVSALGKLVDDLRTLAQSDVGALDVSPAPVDAWQSVLRLADAFGDRLAAAGLALSLEAPAARHAVLADADRLRQILGNLLENACRYTDAPGRVVVTASATPRELRLCIDDTAPGVPAADLPRLGERFFRPDASRSRQRGGSGLGLALCRRLAEAQGGRLAFSASPLGGLRAELWLPLADAPVATGAAAEAA